MEALLSVKGRSVLGWVLAPLVPVSYLYGLGMRTRERLYRAGVLAQQSLSLRVISVGNLTVGGTGKTPIIITLANALRERGRRVGVISRGYGRRDAHAVLEVSDGYGKTVGPEQAGDEPLLIAERCPGVPVAVGANRYDTGRLLLNRFGIDTLLLDDGFQHLALRRNMDILILDATAPFGNGYALPRGRLRESPSSLKRASLIVLTRGRQASEVQQAIAEIRAIAPTIPICVTDFSPTLLLKLDSQESQNGEAVRGQRIVAVSAIGNPDSFRKLLGTMGAHVLKHLVFADHHTYSAGDVRRIREVARSLGADRIVTTEKDAVKLKAFTDAQNQPAEPHLWAVRIEVEWLEGQEEWARIVLSN